MTDTFDVLLIEHDRNLGYSLEVEASLDELGDLDEIESVRLVGGCVFFSDWPTTIDIVPRDDNERQRAGAAILRDLRDDITAAVQSQIERRRECAEYEAAERR